MTDHLESLVVPAGDGFPLAIQLSGPPDGPALLLLPGQANSHVWWTSLRASFDRDFRVVTFDYRGTGASRGVVGSWSTGSFADDAAQILAALHIGSALVYGTSMGGRVAQMLAIRHPDLVERLVLACSSPGGPLARERGPEVRQALAEPDDGRRRHNLHRLFYTDAIPYVGSDGHLLGDPTMTPAERRAHRRASELHHAWADLPTISKPTLVLHGADDEMTPATNADLLATGIPDAHLHIHPRGRHGFFEEFADVITPLVRDFLHQPLIAPINPDRGSADHPWRGIDLDVYERHMSDAQVGQLGQLHAITESQLAAHPSRTIATLGVAGGNGLDLIDPAAADAVYGYDINPDYLAVCEARYRPTLGDRLHLIEADIDRSLDIAPVDLVIANLIVEYIGLEQFGEFVARNAATIGIVSCVIQRSDTVNFVSSTQYTSSFDALESVASDIDPDELETAMSTAGFVTAQRWEYAMPNGKTLVPQDFESNSPLAQSLL